MHDTKWRRHTVNVSRLLPDFHSNYRLVSECYSSCYARLSFEEVNLRRYEAHRTKFVVTRENEESVWVAVFFMAHLSLRTA